MKMCPFNKEGLMAHRLALWMAIRLPFSRRFLIWLDDALRYGVRNPVKRWWLDLEIVDKRVVRPAAASDRDLSPGRKPARDNHNVAVYPFDKLPTADDRDTVPVDRKAGLTDTESAAEALRQAKK